VYPTIFELTVSGQSKPITSYGVFALLGIFAGAFVIIYLARQRGIDTFTATNIVVLLVASGILVSLLVNIIIFLPERLSLPHFFDYPIGVVSWGGVLGGFFAGLYISRNWKIPLLELADFSVPGVALGFAFGRVGCHFAGCCFGLHYEGPFALHFTHPIAAASAAAQPLFPIQLLSALLLLYLAILLFVIALRRVQPGWAFFTYMLLYGTGRFVIEFFRADARGIYFGFSDAQWYSLALLVGAFVLYLHLRQTKQSLEQKA